MRKNKIIKNIHKKIVKNVEIKLKNKNIKDLKLKKQNNKN